MEDIPQALRSSGQPGNPGRERRETFNPTIKQSVIDRAYEDDPAVAASEWGGKFRDDLESYVSPEVVDQCTEPNCTLRPYQPGIQYISHCDPSGDSQDSFCLAVGHIEDGRGVLDCLVEHKPPFSPEAAISDLCAVLQEYRLSMTTGDRYASGFNSELFRKHGVEYYYSDRTTSDYFGGLLPILNSRRYRLLDNKRLASQLCSLGRRPSRIGAKDSISHPPGSHDDCAAAVAGLMVRMIGVVCRHIQGWHPHNPLRDHGPRQWGESARSNRAGIQIRRWWRLWIFGRAWKAKPQIGVEMDMPAIQELSDDRLRELSAAKPTDLDRAQAKVATFEVQFAAARAAHAKNFPRDPRATDPKCQESLQAVDRVENELHWAKKRLALIEAGVRSVELQRTCEEAPEASYIFEVTLDDGRKMRQSAKDAATLQRSLSKGYTVTGRVFPHYTAPVDATAPKSAQFALRAHPQFGFSC